MTTDAFEEPFEPVDRDRFGRYKLPDPKSPEGGKIPWTRATTLARTLSDEFMLNQWRIRQVVSGFGRRPDLAALAAAAHPDDRVTLQSIGDQAQAAAESDKGANLGRALHAFSQRQDLGAPGWANRVPEQYYPYLKAYQNAMEKSGFGIQPEYIERIVVCPEIKVAGQFDRLLVPANATAGRLVVGDLKTAKLESITFAWLEIAIQLSVYAHSTVMWHHDQQKYHAMPDVDLQRAIVMHLPQDLPPDQARCDIYEIDISKGWEYALLAHQVRQARSNSKNLARCLHRESPAPHPDLPRVAEKVDEVRAAPATNRPGAKTCYTIIDGKPYGCRKAHSGPGQICSQCALDLVKPKTYETVMREIETGAGTPPEQVASVSGSVLEMAASLPGVDVTPIVEAVANAESTVRRQETPLDRVQAAGSRDELSALWREGSAAGWWSEELALAGKERLRELRL